MSVSLKKHKNEILPDIHFQNSLIKQTKSMKYLGFFLDDRLNLKKHLSYIKSKTFPLIQNFMRNRIHLTSNVAAIFYKGLIRPILEYCSPSLATSSKTTLKDILAIENRCLKIISPNSKDLTRNIHNIPPQPWFMALSI